MKKTLIFIAVILVVSTVGMYFIFKNNPPLEVITIDRNPIGPNSTIIGVVNKGFRPVEIEEVFVNNNSSPRNSEVLISNAVDRFRPEDKNVDGESKEFIRIEPGMSSSEYITKFDQDQLTKDDIIYGISVIHNVELENVTIKYKYLLISYDTTIHYE